LGGRAVEFIANRLAFFPFKEFGEGHGFAERQVHGVDPSTKNGKRLGAKLGSSPADMRGTSFVAFVEKIGEVFEAAFDIALGTAAVDKEAVTGHSMFGHGDFWRAIAEALASCDGDEGTKGLDRPGGRRIGFLDAEGVEKIGAIGAGEAEFRIAGKLDDTKVIAVLTVGIEGDGHGLSMD
jgi:hypothetical protein